MSGDPKICPACQGDLTYVESGETYSRAFGVNIPGLYDGCLYWMCPFCGHAWHRFNLGDMRYQLAEPHIRQANERNPK